MTPDTDRWGTVNEAAAIAGLSSMTIRRYINKGLLPARRQGVKLLRVDLEAAAALTAPVVPADAQEAAK